MEGVFVDGDGEMEMGDCGGVRGVYTWIFLTVF